MRTDGAKTMTWAFDTNVLVYCHDPRDTRKQAIARALLRQGAATAAAKLPWQVLAEFGGIGARPLRPDGMRLFTPAALLTELDALSGQFEVLYPDADVLQLALRGAALYQLPWLDAVVWAHAERYGCEELYSEDFQHGRRYGAVKVVNPFA